MRRCCSNHQASCWPPIRAVVTASDWPAGAIPLAGSGAPKASKAAIGVALDDLIPAMKEVPDEIEIFLR